MLHHPFAPEHGPLHVSVPSLAVPVDSHDVGDVSHVAHPVCILPVGVGPSDPDGDPSAQ